MSIVNPITSTSTSSPFGLSTPTGRQQAQPGFEALVGRSFGWLVQVALRYVGERLSAEDLVQEALLEAWLAGEGEGGGEAVLAGLERRVIALCRRSLRQAGPARVSLPQEVELEEGEEDRADWTGAGEVAFSEPSLLVRMVAEMPERHRGVLELRFLSEGLSVREMARRRGLSERVFRLRVRDALTCLKKRLSAAGFAPEALTCAS